MKKTYNIVVDCANCANLMENAVKKIDGVKSVIVNFMTQKLVVDFAENADMEAVMTQILAACQKIDSDCEIEL